MVANRAHRPKYMKYEKLTYSIAISYFLHHVSPLKYKNESEGERNFFNYVNASSEDH